MARKRKKGSRRAKKKISLAATAGIAGTLAKGVYQPIKQTDDNYIRAAKIVRNFTGYNMVTNKMEWVDMAYTYAPAVVGGLVAIAGRKFGLNKAMPNMPWVKVF